MFPSKLQLFSWDLKSPAHGELGDTRGCIQLQLLHRARPALPGAPVCSSVNICDPPGRDTPSHRPGEPGSGASPLRRKGEEEKGDIQLCQASAPTTHHPQCWTMPCQNHWQPANSLAAKHHPSRAYSQSFVPKRIPVMSNDKFPVPELLLTAQRADPAPGHPGRPHSPVMGWSSSSEQAEALANRRYRVTALSAFRFLRIFITFPSSGRRR